MNNKESRRATLRARRDVVRSEVRSAVERINDDRLSALADQVHDTKDHAIAQLLLESNDAELRRSATELQDIDAALLRDSTGAYGRCTDCGIEILADRLNAYPTAKRCLPCQEQHEKKR